MYICYNEFMQDLSALYGPLFGFSDYKIGETVTFRKGGVTQHGTIIWVTAPGQVVVEGGKPHGVEYIVDTGGFPEVVVPGQIIVE